ncbi:transporter substrate-binding domain-containing protein [Pseudomonas sp. PS02288]|uniref:transporter substrate-binding domain-containing protein n=1 Tax=Pseudomonas sp. PS02288 TaxID=2991443 RepID=UPI00249ADF40|nr:transporter substrate-binding domain-containing protein [Pseudomonas sp. PS02288]
MRRIALALLVLCNPLTAAERPLRFSISESSTMPMVRIEDGQATGGILYDLQTRLAEKVGRRAQLMVLPRLRVQQMLVRGEIDVRCDVNPAWLKESTHQYIWSVPFMVNRDVLVGAGANLPRQPPPGEAIGTVLGFVYPTLESAFASGALRRDDARTQELVLAKLTAARDRYAVSNELTLDWYDRTHANGQTLHKLGVVASDIVACIVRDEPDVPAHTLLRALVRMSVDGEFEAILARYR